MRKWSRKTLKGNNCSANYREIANKWTKIAAKAVKTSDLLRPTFATEWRRRKIHDPKTFFLWRQYEIGNRRCFWRKFWEFQVWRLKEVGKQTICCDKARKVCWFHRRNEEKITVTWFCSCWCSLETSSWRDRWDSSKNFRHDLRPVSLNFQQYSKKTRQRQILHSSLLNLSPQKTLQKPNL
jgi:hypothetical protein